jgi:hypothetical protein
MSSQAQSLDATVLTPILFLAIYVYIRVTIRWIVSLCSRYANRAACHAKVCRNGGPDRTIVDDVSTPA